MFLTGILYNLNARIGSRNRYIFPGLLDNGLNDTLLFLVVLVCNGCFVNLEPAGEDTHILVSILL